MEDYGKFITKFVVAFVSAAIVGFIIIHFYIRSSEESGLFVKTYYMDDYSAKEDYNEKSVDFLLTNFNNTNVVYSPLSVEKAYVYYATQYDTEIDNIFYVFGNGFHTFDLSKLLLQDESIKCFTVGQGNADINAIPNEKLVLDEINAKFNTLSDGKVVFKATQNNVFDYNTYSLCVIDEEIDAECNETEDNYVIKGKFDSYFSDELSYVVVPLKDSNYELIFKKGIDLYYDRMLPLKTTKQDLTILIPKLTLESVTNPSIYYRNSELNEAFELDKHLTNVTAICHVNIHGVLSEEKLEQTDNIKDFSKSSLFYIRNKETGQLVVVGNLL